MKTVKTLLSTILVLGVCTTNAFAYGIQNNTIPDVSYSIISAINNNDNTIFQDVQDTELHLGKVPVNGFATEITPEEGFKAVLNCSLANAGVHNTVAELLSTFEEDIYNPSHWTEWNTNDWSYAHDNNDKVRYVTFNSQKGNDHYLIRFAYYKNCRDITLQEVYVMNPMRKGNDQLSVGQITKLFKELQAINPKLQNNQQVIQPQQQNPYGLYTTNITNITNIDNSTTTNINGSTIVGSNIQVNN